MTLSKFLSWGLYVGGRYDAEQFELLKKCGITHILSTGTKELTFPSYFKIFRFVIRDRVGEQKILEHFDEIAEFIDEAKNSACGVLLHCDVGQSRSCALAVAYAINREGMTLMSAIEVLRIMRRNADRDVKINSSFMVELYELERNIRGTCSVSEAEQSKVFNRLKKRQTKINHNEI